MQDGKCQEDEIVERWLGVIYIHKKRPKLFVGKAKRRFLMDKNGRASGIEIKCLKPHVGTSTTFESTPSHLKDIEIFNIQNIISKPLTVP